MKRIQSSLNKWKLRVFKPQSQQPPKPNQEPPSSKSEDMAVQNEESAQKPMVHAAATAATLQVALRNNTSSSTVYAYVTGQALDHGNSIFLLRSDARTPYYPGSPSAPGAGLGADCAIRLGAPGTTVNATIPHIAGGRIWFSIGAPLTFKLNPGPALVEPSVTNSSDPNHAVEWAFCEFTFNADQLYANISYVDFVGLPVALDLTTRSSGTQHVAGLRKNGLQQIADGLRAQAKSDGHAWDALIVKKSNGDTLRVLSPNQGMVINPSFLANYFDGYVDQVYKRYAGQTLQIDTQAQWGVVSSAATNNANVLTIGGQSFGRPSTKDILTCSTGPFATGADAERNAIIPRLAAGFNRSTLLVNSKVPSDQSKYYQNQVTNHYVRIVHAANSDGRGYAFPYDDVQPTGGKDLSGEVHAGDPVLFSVTLGGN